MPGGALTLRYSTPDINILDGPLLIKGELEPVGRRTYR